MLALKLNTANLPGMDRFPEYVDPLEDKPPTMAAESARPKPLAHLQSEDSSRGPSPQPTHFSVPLQSHASSNGHRILRSATVGYIAPEFQGKEEQMKTGKSYSDEHAYKILTQLPG
jgi:glutamate dehydrogenase